MLPIARGQMAAFGRFFILFFNHAPLFAPFFDENVAFFSLLHVFFNENAPAH